MHRVPTVSGIPLFCWEMYQMSQMSQIRGMTDYLRCDSRPCLCHTFMTFRQISNITTFLQIRHFLTESPSNLKDRLLRFRSLFDLLRINDTETRRSAELTVLLTVRFEAIISVRCLLGLVW